MVRQSLAAVLLASAALAGCMTSKSPDKVAAATAAPAPAITGAKASPKCANVNFPIYFKSGSSQLTDPAAEAIRMAAVQSKGCRASEVSVVGLADADGSAQVSQALSEDRARAVAAALISNGFPEPAIDMSAAGSQGAKTASGATAPQRRRAEVAISFKK